MMNDEWKTPHTAVVTIVLNKLREILIKIQHSLLIDRDYRPRLVVVDRQTENNHDDETKDEFKIIQQTNNAANRIICKQRQRQTLS